MRPGTFIAHTSCWLSALLFACATFESGAVESVVSFLCLARVAWIWRNEL